MGLCCNKPWSININVSVKCQYLSNLLQLSSFWAFSGDRRAFLTVEMFPTVLKMCSLGMFVGGAPRSIIFITTPLLISANRQPINVNRGRPCARFPTGCKIARNKFENPLMCCVAYCQCQVSTSSLPPSTALLRMKPCNPVMPVIYYTMSRPEPWWRDVILQAATRLEWSKMLIVWCKLSDLASNVLSGWGRSSSDSTNPATAG